MFNRIRNTTVKFYHLRSGLLLPLTLTLGTFFFATINRYNLPTSYASPMAEVAACFPTAPLSSLRVEGSYLGDNHDGDYLIDFDGDGRTDIFTIESNVMKYASQAKQPWQVLQNATFPLDQLRFGDFDGDGITDIFYANGVEWRFSSAGVGVWTRLQFSTHSSDELRFGNFNEDPRTDVFYRNQAGIWMYSSGGSGDFIPLGPTSGIQIEAYRFADLDGNGKTDIFRVDGNGQWFASYDAKTIWTPILTFPTITIDQIRFGQLDNQPGTDVFFEFNNNWIYSSSGNSPIVTLGNATVPLDQLRLGDFDGNGRTDVLSLASNNRWQVEFDFDGTPQFLTPSQFTQAGLLSCASGDTQDTRTSLGPSISNDGTRLVFQSNADLLGQGGNNSSKVWLYDIPSKQLTQITNHQISGESSHSPFISGDGKKIVFTSNANFLGQGNIIGDELWMYDIASGTYERLTNATASGNVSIFGQTDKIGRKIVFLSDNDFLSEGLPNNQNEVWVYDRQLQTYTRLSENSEFGRNSREPSISQDGTKVAFSSDSDMLNQGLPQSQYEIWLYDLGTNNLSQLTNSGAGRLSYSPTLNNNGSELFFGSFADFLNEGRPSNISDIWRFNISSQTFTRLTNTNSVRNISFPKISEDGKTLVFQSDADFKNEGIPQLQLEIWRYDIPSGQLTRLTNSPSRINLTPVVSGNGRFVAFASDADFFGHGEPSGQLDVWLLDAIPPTGFFSTYLPFTTK